MTSQQPVQSAPPAVTEVDCLVRTLCETGSCPNDPLLAALDHHLQSGGQRTRARLALSCGSALGLPRTSAVALAATVECLHNASLVQDDYQDQSTLRRGTETVWKKYGTDTALCLTDLLISTAFAAVTSASEAGQLPAIISRMHAAISKTLRGQMRDTAPEQPTGSRLEASLQIAAAKSSPFFALAMELPLILRGFHEDIPTAGRACHHFGIGYQTYDDLHDLEQDEREGNDKNIVLAMGPPHESEHHVAHAADLAVSHLKRAANLAGLLPNDSGRLLYEQAGRLQNKITGLV